RGACWNWRRTPACASVWVRAAESSCANVSALRRWWRRYTSFTGSCWLSRIQRVEQGRTEKTKAGARERSRLFHSLSFLCLLRFSVASLLWTGVFELFQIFGEELG